MFVLIRETLALVALGSFGFTTLAWMDVLTRLG